VASGAAAAWAALDDAQRRALRLGWEAFQTGNIGVGAVVTTPDGRLVSSGRNRLADGDAPPGQVFGTSVAHAEINALANVRFRTYERELVLTTTLQPCLQCSAAIRMAPIALVRVLGPDPLWDGCEDLTSLTPWVARRPPIPVEHAPWGELAAFATLMARCSPLAVPVVEEALRAAGEGPLLDLVDRLRASDEVAVLAAVPVEVALDRLWSRLAGAAAAMAG
jgi:tRNA(Arg) A34 adenosine deaminase TadA